MSIQHLIREFASWGTKWFCRHRRSWPWRWAGQGAYLVWRAYENRNFDMRTNGEEWCLRQVGHLPTREVFDVGANLGDWLALCRQHIPKAHIHAFEISPKTFQKLQERTLKVPAVILNPFGLSDSNGEIEIYSPGASDYLTTAFKEHLSPAFDLPGHGGQSFDVARGKLVRGDDYAREKGIETIDFLKIDVEGMERTVLHGFRQMLSNHKIRVVQFEYNTPNIVSGFLLREAYQFFRELNYVVGKLYPNYVEFREYHYRQEDFAGPNMIAVRKEDHELIRLLSGV